jgi:hypothetical protein
VNLLRQLDSVLSNVVEAWKSFSSPDEDIGYFLADGAAISPRARLSLGAIKVTFQQLQKNQKKISFLKQGCSDFSKDVSQDPSHLILIEFVSSEEIALTFEM